MKKILMGLVAVAFSASAIASDKLTITQSAGKGTGHDKIINVLVDGLKSSGQEYEYIVGKNCVPAIKAWNDAGDTTPIVMAFTSSSARESGLKGLPCMPELSSNARVYMIGGISHLLCGHDKSKPLDAKGVTVGVNKAQELIVNMVNDSAGTDWKFVDAPSAQALLYLGNKEIDYAVINSTREDKLMHIPGVSCSMDTYTNSTKYENLQKHFGITRNIDPMMNPTSIVVAKNITDSQDAMLREIFNTKNPAFVNLMSKWNGQDVPTDQAAFFANFVNNSYDFGVTLRAEQEAKETAVAAAKPKAQPATLVEVFKGWFK